MQCIMLNDMFLLWNDEQYVFKVLMEFVIGATPEHEKEELTRACEHLISGVSSLQVCIPGTCYWKAIKVIYSDNMEIP